VLFDKYGIDKIASIHLKNGTKEVIVYDQISDFKQVWCLIERKQKI